MVEIWKDIPGYEGLYQGSNLGNVKSLSRKTGFVIRKEKILTPWEDSKKKYLFITLMHKGIQQKKSLHRIVGQLFLGLDINNSKIFVCHKDDNPQNNNMNNLFLGSCKDNMIDMAKKGRASTPGKGKFGKDSPRSKQVNQYDLQGNFIKTWNSGMDIKRALKIESSSICNCCKGKIKTTGNFIFKYLKNV